MSKFSFDTIDAFATLSKDAYLSLEEITDKYGESVLACGEETVKNIRFFMIERDEEVYLSFRGTADLTNALTDGEYVMHYDDDLGVYIHTGFQEAYHSVEKMINAKLDTIIENQTPLNITGHSLGGAVAAMALIHLQASGANLSKVITFGQPKVTDKKGMIKYNKTQLLRVVDQDDVVPLLPPTTLMSVMHGGYRHFGEELLLLGSKYYSLLEERDAEKYKVSSLWGNVGHESLSDHYMVNYLKRINEKLKEAIAVPYSEHKKYED